MVNFCSSFGKYLDLQNTVLSHMSSSLGRATYQLWWDLRMDADSSIAVKHGEVRKATRGRTLKMWCFPKVSFQSGPRHPYPCSGSSWMMLIAGGCSATWNWTPRHKCEGARRRTGVFGGDGSAQSSSISSRHTKGSWSLEAPPFNNCGAFMLVLATEDNLFEPSSRSYLGLMQISLLLLTVIPDSGLYSIENAIIDRHRFEDAVSRNISRSWMSFTSLLGFTSIMSVASFDSSCVTM